MGSLGAPRGRRVHSGSRGFTNALILVSGFCQIRVCSLLMVVGLIPVRVGSLGHDRGRRVHSGLRGFTRVLLGVAGFIGYLVGSPVHS